MAYRDKKTGKFVSASTWKRSKAQGGTRFVRVVGTGQRSPQAVRQTGKATKKVAEAKAQRAKRTAAKSVPPARKPATTTRRKRQKASQRQTQHILTIQIKTRRRDERTGRYRTFTITRDILVPGPANATLAQLKRKALDTLSGREAYVTDWLKQRHPPAKITKVTGPKTRAKKAHLR